MSLRCVLWVGLAAISVSGGSIACAQDSTEQTPSLGDLARQTRAQHATADGQRNKAQDLADQMQRAQEASENAPTGFTTYDAGDYRLFVPFPYSLEGNDPGGPVLLGSRLGVTHTEVLAGTPVPIPPYTTRDTLPTFVRQLAMRYSASAVCAPVELGSHEGFHCAMNNASLLQHSTSGSMEFVVASTSVIPVMCVSPNEPVPSCQAYGANGYYPCGYSYQSRDDYQHYRNLLTTRAQETRDSSRLCEQIVYPSIELKEDSVLPPPTMADSKPKASSQSVPEDTSVAAGPQSVSPAELARETRQAAHTKTVETAERASTAPAGFRTFVLQYCFNPQQCFEASVAIPEKAEVVSHVNGQYIFKAPLDGDYVLLYAGPADVDAPYRSLTDPDWVRVRDLSNVNGWAHGKPDTVTTQPLNIEDRAALMSRVRYQRDQRRWIGERVIVTMPGRQFLLGCTAPEERYDRAEAIWTTLVKSVRLP